MRRAAAAAAWLMTIQGQQFPTVIHPPMDCARFEAAIRAGKVLGVPRDAAVESCVPHRPDPCRGYIPYGPEEPPECRGKKR